LSKDYFNSKAVIWDETVAEKDLSRLESLMIKLDIKPGASVLDIGTGTGVFTPFLLKKIGCEGHLLCLDYAEKMLKIAQAKGFEGNVSYLCADINDSHLADKSFDAVVCYSVYPHFQDKLKVLKEVNRLLKNDGRLFICHTSSRMAINKVHQSIPEVCNHVFPENGETQRILSEAGFADIDISDGTYEYIVCATKPSN